MKWQSERKIHLTNEIYCKEIVRCRRTSRKRNAKYTRGTCLASECGWHRLCANCSAKTASRETWEHISIRVWFMFSHCTDQHLSDKIRVRFRANWWACARRAFSTQYMICVRHSNQIDLPIWFAALPRPVRCRFRNGNLSVLTVEIVNWMTSYPRLWKNMSIGVNGHEHRPRHTIYNS